MGLLAVVVTIVVGILVKPPSIETNFDSFMKTDVNTSTMRDTFLYALSKRTEDSGLQTNGRRLQTGSVLYKHYDLSIVYDLKDNAGSSRGLFDIEILNEIARFEKSLRDIPMYKELCAGVETLDRPFCEPGMSFINFAMPSLTVSPSSIVPSVLTFDGKGKEVVPVETAVLSTVDLGLSGIMLPSDFRRDNMSVSQLRTVIRFKYLCCTSLDTMTYQRQVVGRLNKKWTEFSNILFPVLKRASEDFTLEGAEDEHPVRIYFDGSGFQELEVMLTLNGDKNLAIGSVGFVLFYMLLHTQSILLSFLGLLIIVSAVPFSYVLFTVFTGSQTMSIASFLSLFLIVGLGSDVVFVYTDFWQESKAVKEDLNSRLAWTLWHAGKASFATTVTTAVSFFANLASVLKPMREFGFFMGLCVIFAWVLLTLIFVPLCLLDEKYPCNGWIFRRCGRRSSDGPSWTTRCLGWWMLYLHRWRRLMVPIAVVFSLAAVGWAAASATTDTGVPNIFPRDHNQNRGKEVFGGFTSLNDVFDPLFIPPSTSMDVCSESNFGTNSQSCSLFWCEAKAGVAPSTDGSCKCYKKQRAKTCGSASMASVVQRFVGPTSLSQSQLAGPVAGHIVHATADKVSFQAGRQRDNFMTRRDLAAPLVLQEWESGAVMLKSVIQVETVVVRDTADSSCGWEEICYCGSFVCKTTGTGFKANSDLQLGGAQRRLLSAVSQQWMIPSNMRANVDVIFGLQVIADSPLLGEADLANSWFFDERHEVRQPWAQRNMYSFCTSFPQELKVTSKRCWIEDFRRYVLQRGLRFPLLRNQFDSEVLAFGRTSLTGLASSQDYLWIRGGQVKASYMSFSIDIQKYAATGLALEHQKKWDKYLARYNADASRFARDAWHTSALWVRAEAQDELIMSTVITLLIVILLAFLGMVVFTRNATLSLSVVLATCGVVCNLFFYITVMMGWAIGPIEVIALIVFIGYAVTYSLHIAHRYGSSDARHGELPEEVSDKLSQAAGGRYLRTRFALQTIGGAALGSAVTTAGCSIFLIFCTLTIFKKLGGVVLAVTLLSIFFALVPLPAALLMVGPAEPGRRCLPAFSEMADCMSEMEGNVGSMLAWRPWSNRPAEDRPPDGGASPPPAAPGTGGGGGAGERRNSGGGLAVDGPRQGAAEPRYSGVADPRYSGVADPRYSGVADSRYSASGAQLQPTSRYPAAPLTGGGGPGVPSISSMTQPGAHHSHFSLPPGSQRSSGHAPNQGHVHAGPSPIAPSAASAGAANDRRRRLSEMDFDIGTESPLECIWSREAVGGMPRPMDARRNPRPAAL